MDRALRACVAAGADPVTALQFATINAAQCLGVDADMGSVTPGKCADLVILPDLESFVPDEVLIDDELVAQDGHALFDNPLFEWPDFMTHTMNVGRSFTASDFEIHVDRPDGFARVRAIGGVGGSTITQDCVIEVPVRDGKLEANPEIDALKMAGIEQAWADMGCKMPSPFMTMGILSLPCVPELRLTNRGYVNCVTFQFENLLVKD